MSGSNTNSSVEQSLADRPDGIEFERHFSPQEVAELWGLSVDTVRDIFKAEPGVLKFGRPESKYKRAYETIRIPESVVRRAHHRRRNRQN